MGTTFTESHLYRRYVHVLDIKIHDINNFLVADDNQALIWDLQHMSRTIEDPILAYKAEAEINQIQWSISQPDWIAICYNKSLEILRV